MKAEAAVRDRLKAAGHRVLWLHYLVSVRRTDRFSKSRRQKGNIDAVKIKRPVLPSGYVFARLTINDIAAARGIPGVAGFCGTEAGAGPIPDAEMEAFLAWGNDDGVVTLDDPQETRRSPFKLGTVVRVLDGPFGPGFGREGFDGVVERDDGKQLLQVAIEIFGRKTLVSLPYEAVEVIWKAA